MVLLLAVMEDNGGNGHALKRALERNTDWEVRCVRRRNNFLDYPVDFEWTGRSQDPEVQRLFSQADVVVMLGAFDPAQKMPGYDRKPKVMYHLGQRFRDNRASYIARCRAEGIPQLATTFDLLYEPDIAWLPMACDADLMAEHRKAYRPGPKVRVMQTPAARGPNDTDLFEQAVRNLDIDLRLIEGVPWREALALKAQADILFDSFATGYGLSVIEAWGMGIPAVCGSGDELVEQRIRDTLGGLPYLPSTPETVAAQIQTLADDLDLRAQCAEFGRQVVNDFHADAKVAERLIPVIESVL